jgi:hypothetical protein
MPNPLINTPEALDAAIEATREIRRERLLQAVRKQRLLNGAAFGLATCVALFALAALVYGDLEAATVTALMACLAFGFTIFAGKFGRKRTMEALRKLDHST